MQRYGIFKPLFLTTINLSLVSGTVNLATAAPGNQSSQAHLRMRGQVDRQAMAPPSLIVARRPALRGGEFARPVAPRHRTASARGGRHPVAEPLLP